MRKLILLLSLLSALVLPLCAADSLLLAGGDAASVRLYSPYGQALDPLSAIDADGYIIQVQDTDAVFTSAFGDIAVSPDSLVAVTGFNYDSPSIYLLDGQIQVTTDSLSNLTIFTSSASYTISGPGEYIFVYTDSADIAINNSASNVAVYDALRRASSTIRPYHYSNLLENQLDLPLLSLTETDGSTVSGSYSFRGLSLDYSFTTEGSGYVSYPSGLVSESNVGSFFLSFASDSGLAGLDSVVYTWQDGRIDFTYPSSYTADEISAVVTDFLIYLDNYLSGIFTPPAPEFAAPVTTVEAQQNETEAGGTQTQAAQPETETPADSNVPVPPAPFMVRPWVTVQDQEPAEITLSR